MMRFVLPFLQDSPRVATLQFQYSGWLQKRMLSHSSERKRRRAMAQITLSTTPKGNGYQGTITYSYGVSISSTETFPTIAEAISAAAIKMLEMPERLEEMDRSELTA
jgi:hypothetical protein